MYLIILLLAALLLFHFSRKEPYENYDETSCLQLAQKNQANLESLQKDVDALLALKSKVQSIQNTTDSNSKQLSTLVDQVYKTPQV
jgi:Tfp pilus assembly protein PilN